MHNDLFQRAEVLVHNRERILHLLRSHASPPNPHEPLQLLRLGSHDLAPVQAVHGSLARLVLSDDRCSGGIYNRNTRMLVGASQCRRRPPLAQRHIAESGSRQRSAVLGAGLCASSASSEVVHKMSAQCLCT